jgi:hypothetical protein
LLSLTSLSPISLLLSPSSFPVLAKIRKASIILLTIPEGITGIALEEEELEEDCDEGKKEEEEEMDKEGVHEQEFDKVEEEEERSGEREGRGIYKDPNPAVDEEPEELGIFPKFEECEE